MLIGNRFVLRVGPAFSPPPLLQAAGQLVFCVADEWLGIRRHIRPFAVILYYTGYIPENEIRMEARQAICSTRH